MAGSKRNKLKKAFSPITSPQPTEAAVEDEELMDDLLAQLDSRDQTVQAESATVLQEMTIQQAASDDGSRKQDAKSRFRARQARKAVAKAENYSPNDPEADARLQKEAKDEEKAINRICEQYKLQLHEVNPDGHCLFSSIADQLVILGILSPEQATYATIRLAASTYIYSHPDDFLPFLPSGGDEDGALDSGIMSPSEFEKYCLSIRDTGVWGGELEILALSKAYNVPIHVAQGGSPPVVVHDPAGMPNQGDTPKQRVAWISYHRRMYGLGEHYNSLRPIAR